MTLAASTYDRGYTGRAKHDAHVRYFDHPTWSNVYVEVYRAKDSHRIGEWPAEHKEALAAWWQAKRAGKDAGHRPHDPRPRRITNYYYADPSWGERVACDTEAQAVAIAERMLAAWQDATATLPGREVPPRRVLHGDGF